MGYVHLSSCLGAQLALEYHIVELEWACRIGASLFPDDGRVRFHASLPEAIGRLDIIFLKSVLHYIEDYAGLLKSLCDYRAKYVLISDFFAGNFPTLRPRIEALTERFVPVGSSMPERSWRSWTTWDIRSYSGARPSQCIAKTTFPKTTAWCTAVLPNSCFTIVTAPGAIVRYPKPSP